MKIAVLGSGAMGCLYGGMLAMAGHSVTLIDIWKEHIEEINSRGLKIESSSGEHVIRNVKAVTEAQAAGEVDLVLVFVKATATAAAMAGAKSLVTPSAVVLTLQNGLGNVEALSGVIDPARVIAGTSGHGATMLGPGHIRHAGEGDTVIGEPGGGESARVETLAEILRQSGIAAKTTDNVMGIIWTKLIVNVGINALTAITGLRNGRLVELPETDQLLRLAVEEACSVAKAKGIRLETDDAVEHTRNIAKKTAGNISSMLQDIMAGRQTEISVINGAVAAEGEKLGMTLPVNIVLTNLVLARQKTYAEE